MRTINRYIRALKFCDALERAGMVSLQMPEANIFISEKISESDKPAVVEAIGIYVRTYQNMSRLTLAAKVTCAAILLYNLKDFLG